MSATWWGELPSPWFAGPERAELLNASARAVSARTGVSSSQAVQQLQRELMRHGVEQDALAVRDDLLVLDARRAPRLEAKSLIPTLEHMTELVANFADKSPGSVVVAAGRQATFEQALGEVGRDALLWAALRAARPGTTPLRLDVSLKALSTRLDDNPLALVRRAHARLAQVSGAGSSIETSVMQTPAEKPTSPGGVSPEGAAANSIAGQRDPNKITSDKVVATGLVAWERPSDETLIDGALAASLVLLEQAAHAPRVRPYVIAIENLAASSLCFIERAAPPELWTNMNQLRAARRVLSATLQAVRLTAPVPY